MSRRLVLIATLLAAPSLAAAQRDASDVPTVTVTGEASLSVPPDEAEVELGVVTSAADADAATSRNARQVQGVLEALRAGLGPDAAVETVGYTVLPERRDPRDGGEPAITGYTASNIVRITLHDLSRVGAVIDRALGAGANHVRRVAFSLRDEEAASTRALRQAAANARSRAAAIAEALGVELDGLLSASSGSQHVPRPFDAAVMQARAGGAATPIEPGPIEVRATVTLTMAVRGADRGRAPP